MHAILLSKNQLENFVDNPLFQQAVQSGLISNPKLIEDLAARHAFPYETKKFYFEVADLWCPSCAEVIRLILMQKPGVVSCHVDYATDLASIIYSPRQISKEVIFQIIRSIGYTPVDGENTDRPAVSRSLYLRFAVAAFCSLNVMMFAYPLYATYFDYDPLDYGLVFAWLSCAMSLPVLFYSGAPIIKRFFSSLKAGILGMEMLVVFGVGASFVLSLYELVQGQTKVYFDAMTVIITFVLLGKIIESKAKYSTKHALLRLNRSLPKRGRKIFDDGSKKFVPIKEIQAEDLIAVFAGEKIVLDGVVVEGSGCCDEALVTGESLPLIKTVGSSVLGGAILQQGCLVIKVTANSEKSMLRRIIGMVEENIGHKSTYTRAIDPIIQWFVPCVFFIAACSAFFAETFEEAFLRALSVILISCPCAIGIAAPLVESYLMQGLASMGVLIRNRGALASLGKETVYVFDKTGTITHGRFEVLSGLEGLSTDDRQILKGMTSQSNHLISLAITHSVPEEKIVPQNLVEIIGKGLKADDYLLGSRTLMEEHEIDLSYHDTDRTTVYFAKNGVLLTVLMLGDRIRPEAKELIHQLSPTPCMVLSGDSEGPVASVAKTCGFAAYASNRTPIQKRAYIESLRQNGEIICMLGDGINDAPSLAVAHIGISVAAATDISIQSSDILLTTDNLGVLPKIRLLARQGRRIMYQNIFWAFFYNIIGIGLAAFGLLSPIFSTFAMMISSLIVYLNALRLNDERNL